MGCINNKYFCYCYFIGITTQDQVALEANPLLLACESNCPSRLYITPNKVGTITIDGPW